ncbi:MAG TPA: beta-glucosidase BglX [Opitutaceae bacterium]|jgi:beta-glucosidase
MYRTPTIALASALALAVPAAALLAQETAFPAAQAEGRANAILAQMTLEEKVGQLNQLSTGSLTGPKQVVESGDDLIKKGEVGAILNAVTAHDTNIFQKEAIDGSRLHIPILFGLDVIHGFRTAFPIPLGLSASWDAALVRQTAHFAGREAASQGVRWTFSPMVDIARDPRWGRIAEGAGEDPYLGSVLAVAYVRGYQGDRLDDPGSILACAKHFVGYGAAEGGREYNTTEISERTLRDVYLPPFHAAVDAGVGTLMSAFNALDGIPASANPFTLTHILRGEWHFQGFVDSDWTAVREVMLHGIADDERTAARKCFLAGVDMDMQSSIFIAQLPELVRSGRIPESRLDEAVRSILRIKIALGLFDHPYVPETPEIEPAASRDGVDLARVAAEESFVLLKNRKFGTAPLLPLSAQSAKRLALIGPLADSAVDMLGSWSCQGRAKDMTTLRGALAEHSKALGLELTYAQGTEVNGTSEAGFADALKIAKTANVVIMALGENGRSSGEASSRAHIDLLGNQERLLEAVVGAGKPVVLVVFSGRPLAIEWASSHVPAILMAWFPGMEAGPALVRTLFGESDPSGRLTVSVPRYVGQVPIYYNHLNTGRPRVDPIGLGTTKADPYYVTGYIDEPNTPLYPFGFGLTYTSFSYSQARVSATHVSAAALNSGAARIKVSADIQNTGSREGTETAQLYIRLRGTSVARPVSELKGFERFRLKPGETRTVDFELGRSELSFWNAEMKEVVEPASLYVWVGPDCTRGVPVRVDLTD